MAGDNVLLQEPVGVPAITGVRDVVDLALFSTIAMTIAWLVASAQRDRLRAGARRGGSVWRAKTATA